MTDFIDLFLTIVTAILIILVFVCFLRAIKGPTIADKLVAINMIGTISIIIIAVLTVLLNEAWLADIAAVYAMISFLAVVVFTKIYIGVYREKNQQSKAPENGGDNNG